VDQFDLDQLARRNGTRLCVLCPTTRLIKGTSSDRDATMVDWDVRRAQQEELGCKLKKAQMGIADAR
jgi:hypothetical protein